MVIVDTPQASGHKVNITSERMIGMKYEFNMMSLVV